MSELRFETKKIRVADLGKESCVPDLLGELTMQNSLEFHLDETDEITIYYKTEDMTEDEDPLEMSFPMMSSAEANVYQTEGEGHFIPETGEIVLSEEQYENDL